MKTTKINRREFIRWLAGAVVLGARSRPADLLAEIIDPSLMEDYPVTPEPGRGIENFVQGLYVPGWKAVTRSGVDSLVSLVEGSGLNALMVDIKNSWGELFYSPETDLAREIGCQARTSSGYKRALQIDYLLEQARRHDIRLIARHVMFRDVKLYDAREDLRLWRKRSEKWIDLRKDEVVDYNLALLEEEAGFGFDEIVLDYIRFPATNMFGSGIEKCVVIDNIVRKAGRKVRSRGVDLGVQIFGYAAWHHRKAGVGQRISTLDPSVDVIYPMLYPSHFWPGSLGFKNPSDHPYEIIASGYREAVKKVKTGTRIIPMIQAFWYPEEKITLQLNAVVDDKMPGYVCWNPSGRYKKFDVPLKERVLSG